MERYTDTDHDLIIRMDERLSNLEKDVSKVANGKTIDLIVKGGVIVLGLLEAQSRTNIEFGTAKDVPTAAIKLVLAIIGG
jgi:hypothetical protein